MRRFAETVDIYMKKDSTEEKQPIPLEFSMLTNSGIPEDAYECIITDIDEEENDDNNIG